MGTRKIKSVFLILTVLYGIIQTTSQEGNTTATTAATTATTAPTTATTAPTTATTALTTATTAATTATTAATTAPTTATTAATTATTAATTATNTASTATATTAATTATTAPTTATTAPTTATTVPITVASKFTYTVSLGLPNEPFTVALNNRESSTFKALEQKLVGPCNKIYKKKFVNFDKCSVKEFRQRPIKADGVDADLNIGFNSASELPADAVVAETLVTAVNSNSSTFNVMIDPTTVKVLESPVLTTTTAATTATTAATTATTAATTATTAATAATTAPAPATTAPATTATAPATTAATTATTGATTTAAITTKQVVFRSLQQTFTTDLLDTSSAAFKGRAANIKNQLEPLYRNKFSSFSSLEVVKFSNGSIINSCDLKFIGTTAPDGTAIANVLLDAASSVTGFDIDGSSITVDGIASSGVSQQISLITASCLVLLSWLLSSQQ